jgi:hypothetical protein
MQRRIITRHITERIIEPIEVGRAELDEEVETEEQDDSDPNAGDLDERDDALDDADEDLDGDDGEEDDDDDE